MLYQSAVESARGLIRHQENQTREQQQAANVSRDDPSGAALTAAGRSAAESLRRLVEKLRSLVATEDSVPSSSSAPVEFMLSVDEDHVLADLSATGGDIRAAKRRVKSLYDCLCSSLTFFTHLPFFTVFSSTVPKLSGLAWPTQIPSSALTELPFDCHPSFPLDPKTLKPEDVSKIGTMVKFGRVLSACLSF